MTYIETLMRRVKSFFRPYLSTPNGLEALFEEEKPVAAPKRKRGRPRKHPVS